MPINLIFTIAHNFSLSFSKPYKMLRFFSYCCCCSISLFLKLVSETQMLNDFYRVLIFHISNDFNALQKKNALKHSSGVAVTLDQTIFAHLICKTNNDGLFKQSAYNFLSLKSLAKSDLEKDVNTYLFQTHPCPLTFDYIKFTNLMSNQPERTIEYIENVHRLNSRDTSSYSNRR